MLRSATRRSSLQLEQLGERICLSSSPGFTIDLQPAAVQHGVTVLAWARVDGTSPLRNESTTSQAENTGNYFNGRLLSADDLTREQSRSTVQDDIWVDGRIITAENYHSTMLEDAIAMHGYIKIKKLNSGG